MAYLPTVFSAVPSNHSHNPVAYCPSFARQIRFYLEAIASQKYVKNSQLISFRDNQNGILFSKLFRATVRKTNVLVTEKKLLKFETELIYQSSEKSVQFIKQNAFLTCFWRLFRSNTLELLIIIEIGKNNWDL